MRILDYTPTRSSAKWSKIIAISLSVISLILCAFGFYITLSLWYSTIGEPYAPLALVILEVIVLVIVITGAKRLMSMAVGFANFYIFFFIVVLMFLWCFGAELLISPPKPAEKPENKEKEDEHPLPTLLEYIIFNILIIALIIGYFIRFLSVLYVSRWARMSDEAKSASDNANRA